MSVLLDACAMIALLRLEPGALVVRQALRDNPGACFAHAVNLCEVYYQFVRATNVATAARALQVLANAGVVTRDDMDPAFWQDVGDAMARRLGAEFLTTDHHEMDALVPLGLCPIRFIR